MANEMRDRLVELLKGAETKVTEMLSKPLALEEWLGIYADHLIANGVVVPPCKVGETLYRIVDMSHTVHNSFVDDFPIKVEPYSIIYENMMGHYASIPFEQFGKTVFLTKEDAEQKLKEMRGDKNA